MISAAADILGRELTDAEMRHLVEGMRDLNSQHNNEGLPILTMTEDEIFSLHGKLSSTLQSFGLTGLALDNALADAFQAAARHIDRERLAGMARRTALTVISN